MRFSFVWDKKSEFKDNLKKIKEKDYLDENFFNYLESEIKKKKFGNIYKELRIVVKELIPDNVLSQMNMD